MFPHSRSAFRYPIRGMYIPPRIQPTIFTLQSPTNPKKARVTVRSLAPSGTWHWAGPFRPTPLLVQEEQDISQSWPPPLLQEGLLPAQPPVLQHMVWLLPATLEPALLLSWVGLQITFWWIVVHFRKCTWTPSRVKLYVAYSWRLVVFYTTLAETSKLGGTTL